MENTKQTRYLQHLRSEIMNSKEEAISKLNDMVSSLYLEKADGVQLISRYRSNDKIISLVGIVAVDDNNNSNITIVNAEDAYVTKDEFETAINELKEQINANTSNGNTEEKDEFGSGYDIDTDYWIHCEYDVTNISNYTYLLGRSDGSYYRVNCNYTNRATDLQIAERCIYKMKIDNILLDKPVNYFKFETLGKHTADFLLKDTTKMPEVMFYAVHNLTKIIIPFSVESLDIQTFGECENLHVIQFNGISLPKVELFTFNNVNVENGVLRIRKSIDSNQIIGEYDTCNDDGVTRILYTTLPTTWTVEYID